MEADAAEDQTLSRETALVPVGPYPTGTHLRVWCGGFYHHGIYWSDGLVIHYDGGKRGNGPGVVVATTLEEFAAGQPIEVVADEARYEPTRIALRALSRLGEQDYAVCTNNCEHFAAWCRRGEPLSQQITYWESVGRRLSSMGAKLVAAYGVRQVAGMFVPTAVRRAARWLPRLGTPWLVAADFVQVAAEATSVASGQTEADAEQNGKRAGLAASAGIGLLCGGFFGAAVGAGLWVAGEFVSDTAISLGRRVIQGRAS